MVFDCHDSDEHIARTVGWCDLPLYFPLAYTVLPEQPDTVEVLEGQVMRRFKRNATLAIHMNQGGM